VAAVERGYLANGYFVALLFRIPTAISAFNSWPKPQLVDKQTGIQWIRTLSWKQFEELVAAAYRRKGYTVVEYSGAAADGGVASGKQGRATTPGPVQAMAVAKGRGECRPGDARPDYGGIG